MIIDPQEVTKIVQKGPHIANHLTSPNGDVSHNITTVRDQKQKMDWHDLTQISPESPIPFCKWPFVHF